MPAEEDDFWGHTVRPSTANTFKNDPLVAPERKTAEAPNPIHTMRESMPPASNEPLVEASLVDERSVASDFDPPVRKDASIMSLVPLEHLDVMEERTSQNLENDVAVLSQTERDHVPASDRSHNSSPSRSLSRHESLSPAASNASFGTDEAYSDEFESDTDKSLHNPTNATTIVALPTNPDAKRNSTNEENSMLKNFIAILFH